MFTGLVLETATVERIERGSSGAILDLRVEDPIWSRAQIGDSICTSGVCLTLVEHPASQLRFEVSPETLDRSNLGELKPGARVHLEPSLAVGERLGGHVVTGHVDAVGEVLRLEPVGDGKYWSFEIAVTGEARARVAPFLVDKGSIAIDGVSLTVNRVWDETGRTRWEMMLIPHTLKVTRFGGLRPGARVNLEADVLAKYAARSLDFARRLEAEGKNS